MFFPEPVSREQIGTYIVSVIRDRWYREDAPRFEVAVIDDSQKGWKFVTYEFIPDGSEDDQVATFLTGEEVEAIKGRVRQRVAAEGSLPCRPATRSSGN